jgi:hypothetical protein
MGSSESSHNTTRRIVSTSGNSGILSILPIHVCVINGVFEPDPGRGVRFIEGDELDKNDAEAAQAGVRSGVPHASICLGLLEQDNGKEMEQWEHGGGFSLDATVSMKANDRHGRA